ncbi:hypothetical protein OROHE_021431 [Orobanche hederae]
MSKIFDLVGEWLKEGGVWRSFMLGSTGSLEMKAEVLKCRLNS